MNECKDVIYSSKTVYLPLSCFIYNKIYVPKHTLGTQETNKKLKLVLVTL